MFKVLFHSPLQLVVFITCCLLLVLLATQVAIPLITDTPLFPIFSRKPKIKKDIHDLNEKLEEDDLEIQAAQLRAKLAQRQARSQSANQTQQPPPPTTASAPRRTPRPRNPRNQ